MPLEADRVYNFNPGPGTMPVDVLKEVQAEFLNFNGSGESIVEISHRAPQYAAVHAQAKADIKELMGLGDDYEVLFMTGGASTQFALLPLNFATKEHPGSYVLSGSFAEKCYKEGQHLGLAEIVASSKETGYHHVPQQDELKIDPNAAYVHVCYNNTIYGTEYHYVPDTKGVPLFADMSSDMLSRPVDFKKFDFIYAGVQKNLGPAGVTLVIAKKALLEKSPESLPTMFRYNTFLKKDSLYNTPPAFCIYFVGKVAAWLRKQGGLKVMAERNQKKAALLYAAIDNSNGFYRGHADKESRSFMNVTFRLPSEELEKKFVAEAAEQKLCGVKGHRSVGGMRASIYNAMPYEGVELLADFMEKFRKANA
ncbi:MAG: 3-phosphoserine/phosphohydroxythreonine transaminase [Selenomonas sp.]|jgi:phosphoserine aminotransferase|nr:3-phosphoserine/phosphohydroxythreonine transaminase [Selenomonas sp.]MCI7330399.1 3-phosphoserine/phosphohydroxythreonine transaminase [Selenomonadaceae bacterium]MDD6119657.1 3-phosphoserine/phosphohydroxythreonine transaminase [Selenomonadaceae bacterium]MDD7056648.1 3-phosphoserine/phosphohydroxythreonine transaminase [Selenomonadaceae bacterium]HBT78857.1 3-phosphoserine/phosphohydroxythreonine transaminase [Selenomonas sp.]